MDFLFAIPMKDDMIFNHFGGAKEFCLIPVINNTIKSQSRLISPNYSYGEIPEFLIKNKVTHVIANGIGQQAIKILTENQVEVIWGVPDDKPELLVKAYLDSQLAPGLNFCDH